MARENGTPRINDDNVLCIVATTHSFFTLATTKASKHSSEDALVNNAVGHLGSD